MLCKISLCLDCVRMLNSRRLTIEGSCIIKFKDYNKWFRLVGAFNSYLQLYMIDTTSNALWIKLEKSRVIVKQFDAILIVLYGSLAHDKCTKLKKKKMKIRYMDRRDLTIQLILKSRIFHIHYHYSPSEQFHRPKMILIRILFLHNTINVFASKFWYTQIE